jgi:polysaccharide biosynthesis/export protein
MRTKTLLILITTCQLCACTLIPGQHMAQFSTESSLDVPTRENNQAILKKLNIKPITAQSIVDLEKDSNNYIGGHDNVTNLYYDFRIGSKARQGAPAKSPSTQYRVGPRDILTITVWDHPELTIPAGEFRSAEASGTLVGEDGNIFYPYAGVMKAAGKTVEEIREQLTQKLAVYIEQVQLDVRVADYRSQRVYVVGEVTTPGVQLVKDIPLTVLEAINRSGGLSPRADSRNVTLTRNDKTYNVNLQALYEIGDLKQNVLLENGDVLNVPDNSFNKVFVLGESNLVSTIAGGSNQTQRSRTVMMEKGRMTMAEALSDGGGFNQETADAARVFVFRNGLGKPQIFHLDTKSPDALLLADRFPLQPHDIIFIDRAEGIRWNQVMGQVQPTMNVINSVIGPISPTKNIN